MYFYRKVKINVERCKLKLELINFVESRSNNNNLRNFASKKSEVLFFYCIFFMLNKGIKKEMV
jgi:hypothetical protein